MITRSSASLEYLLEENILICVDCVHAIFHKLIFSVDLFFETVWTFNFNNIENISFFHIFLLIFVNSRVFIRFYEDENKKSKTIEHKYELYDLFHEEENIKIIDQGEKQSLTSKSLLSPNHLEKITYPFMNHLKENIFIGNYEVIEGRSVLIGINEFNVRTRIYTKYLFEEILPEYELFSDIRAIRITLSSCCSQIILITNENYKTSIIIVDLQNLKPHIRRIYYSA